MTHTNFVSDNFFFFDTRNFFLIYDVVFQLVDCVHAVVVPGRISGLVDV